MQPSWFSAHKRWQRAPSAVNSGLVARTQPRQTHASLRAPSRRCAGAACASPYTPARAQPEGSCARGRAALGGEVLRHPWALSQPWWLPCPRDGAGGQPGHGARVGADLCLAEMLSFPCHRQLGRFPSLIANIGVADPLRQVCCQGRRFLPWGAFSVPAFAWPEGRAAAVAELTFARAGNSVQGPSQWKPLLRAFGWVFDLKRCKTQRWDPCALFGARRS